VSNRLFSTSTIVAFLTELCRSPDLAGQHWRCGTERHADFRRSVDLSATLPQSHTPGSGAEIHHVPAARSRCARSRMSAPALYNEI
jgi:hypothetical protein